jgi:hypothetical protein
MEVIVAQAACREIIERGHLDRPAKSARLPEADVVQEDYDHVRRAFRRPDFEAPRGLGIASVECGDHRRRRLGYWQYRAIELLRGRLCRCGGGGQRASEGGEPVSCFCGLHLVAAKIHESCPCAYGFQGRVNAKGSRAEQPGLLRNVGGTSDGSEDERNRRNQSGRDAFYFVVMIRKLMVQSFKRRAGRG